MEYVTCDLCRGDGLIGNGPEPHLKQGEVITCPKCKGTGKIPTGPVQNEPEVVAPAQTAEEEKKSEPVEEIPQVDQPVEVQPEPAPEVL